MNRKKNIFLTGAPSSGKTTVIQKVIAALPWAANGFYTMEERVSGVRVGFILHSLNGMTGYLAHQDISSDYHIRRYGVSIENIENIAVPTVRPVKDQIIILDEIGKMECFSQLFMKAALTALNAANIVVGTITLGGEGFIQEVKERDDITILEVTPDNRDLLPQKILQMINDLREDSKLELLSISRIWDRALHSAFTDLISYHGDFFCCFREADSHGGTPGIIRILRSTDGSKWSSVATLAKEGTDLRDPKLSIMPDGRLLLTLGSPHPYIAFSGDGVRWSPIIPIDLPNEWIWRLTWNEGVGYGVSYRYSDPKDLDKPWIATLHKTIDGEKYETITTLDVPNYPSEATLRFMPDGTMLALIRRDGNGWIGQATPPYAEWKWSDSGTRIGGPNFIITPSGQMFASGRLSNKDGTFTAIGPMTTSSYSPQLVLPSGGDTSYPGMALRDNIIYVSYYSSHEGKSAIYLARIKIKE